MGPITLFDKSFLQGLSLGESVWCGQYFMPVGCPLFYVETLADLEKAVKEGRTPEQEVGVIAAKFPGIWLWLSSVAEIFGRSNGFGFQLLAREGTCRGAQVKSNGAQ